MANNVPVAPKPVSAAGGVLYADRATTGPEDAVEALAAGFLATGYIGDDGISETNEHGTDDVTVWGGSKVRTLQNDHSLTYTFTFTSARNLNLLRLNFGPDNVNVTATGGVSIAKTDYFPERKSFVFDMIDQGKKLRIYVPNGQVALTGDSQYTNTAPLTYEVTVTCYADEDGVLAWEFREDDPDSIEVVTP